MFNFVVYRASMVEALKVFMYHCQNNTSAPPTIGTASCH